jgi:hypothetical protein
LVRSMNSREGSQIMTGQAEDPPYYLSTLIHKFGNVFCLTAGRTKYAAVFMKRCT